jgi:hypothetical protein
VPGEMGQAGRQLGSRQRAPVGGGGGGVVAQFKVSRIYDKENFEMYLVMDLWDKDLKRGLRICERGPGNFFQSGIRDLKQRDKKILSQGDQDPEQRAVIFQRGPGI